MRTKFVFEQEAQDMVWDLDHSSVLIGRIRKKNKEVKQNKKKKKVEKSILTSPSIKSNDF